MHKENLSQMFREYQEKGDEDCGVGPSTVLRTVSGTSKEAEITSSHQQLEIKRVGISGNDVGHDVVKNSILRGEDGPSDFAEETNSEVSEEKIRERENDERSLDLNISPHLEIPIQSEMMKQSSEAASTGTVETNHKEDSVTATEAQSPSENADGETLETPEILEKLTPEVEEEEEDFVDLKEESNLPFTSEECASKPSEEHTLEESQITEVIPPLKEPVLIDSESKSVEASVETQQGPDSLPEISASEIGNEKAQPNSNVVEKIDGENTDYPQMKTTTDNMPPHTSEMLVASDKKIAKLDVSSVASDTEKLELKSNASLEVNQPIRSIPQTPRQQDLLGQSIGAVSDGQRRDSRSTMFRIPEFRWSQMHQRLLTDLLFSIETDVQMWRSHSTKTVMDFVNSSDNVIFVHNTIHLISQVMDNMIMACGGILPLLSAATSATHELEDIEPTQGLSIEASVAFLQRLISLVDVLIFASSLGFTEIESEKNMSSGGILRQCLRLVCAVAVRNCLECQQQHALMKPSGENSPVDIVTGGISPIRDIDRLLQDMDINRLRAVVFRDIEDSKQAQFLALAVVYFISVLMVSKYRDILEPQDERRQPQSVQSVKTAITEIESPPVAIATSTPVSAEESESVETVQRRDSGIEEEAHSGLEHDSEPVTEAQSVSAGPDAVSEVLCTLSSEVNKSQENTSELQSEVDSKTLSSLQTAKNVNVKDILRSLVSAPAGGAIVDPAILPPTFLGILGDGAAEQPVQSVVVAPKKSVASSTTAVNVPANAVSVVSSLDSTQAPDVTGGSPVSSVPEDSASNMSITERLEHALEKAAPLLREIFVDFAPFLSRTLLGSHGQELLIEGTSLVCMKSSSSVVELVMLLCSQD
ncbi:hypothetical protein JD844_026807 [Phrynosoma platyrhinos]|uniref:Uncharacterized protein n=1 Tax=Phrynosoma platyrhinos TaxID=52577 RepID=A0ABQ7SFB1_PHRPL|nr:hypothetical protein JD844_026807 [Phrynosoma platyrhinos]